MRTATQQATWLSDNLEAVRSSYDPVKTAGSPATRSVAGFFGVFALLAVAALVQMALYPEFVADILGH